MNQETKKSLMRALHEEVEKGIAEGEAPFAAFLVTPEGEIVEKAHAITHATFDPTAHAEIILLRKVGQRFKKRFFSEYALFTNAAPCSMCMSAALQMQISNFYYGAPPEDTLQPYLIPEEVAKRVKREVYIEGGILKEESEVQIKDGRARVPRRLK